MKLGGDLCVPPTANSKRAVMEFLDGVEAWDNNTYLPSKGHTKDIAEAICFLLSTLSLTGEDNSSVIQFLMEELKLLSKNKTRRRYSTEFLFSKHTFPAVCKGKNIRMCESCSTINICSCKVFFLVTEVAC